MRRCAGPGSSPNAGRRQCRLAIMPGKSRCGTSSGRGPAGTGEVVSLRAGDVQNLPHAARPSWAAALRPVRPVNRRRPVVCQEVPLHHLVLIDDNRVRPDGGVPGQRPDSRPWCRATLRLLSVAGGPVGLGAGRSQLGRSRQGPVTLPRPRPSARSTGHGSAPWRHRRRGLGSSRGLHFRLGWGILPVPDRIVGLEIGAILALFVRSRQLDRLPAQISRPDRRTSPRAALRSSFGRALRSAIG